MSVDLHEIVNKNLVSIFLRATVCHLAKEGKKGDVFERKGFTSKLKPCFFHKLFPLKSLSGTLAFFPPQARQKKLGTQKANL